jgi:UDP-N-acetylmuramoyl-tripeptide--D-alanyl-D-alanine ligase
MSYKWHNQTADQATHGKSSTSWQGNNIVIDSRKITKGDVFLALPGEHVDGHDFVPSLTNASAAIVSKKIADATVPLLMVKDTQEALVALAEYRRKQYHKHVIGVTGSVGKTSTKEQLLICFNALGKAYASSGNYNNHLGLPLSLANLDLDVDFAIFEMGMSAAGEIAHLTNIAKPHVAIITSIAPAHLEFFSSTKEIAKAKAEIFQGLDANGTAIINIDAPWAEYIVSIAKDLGIKHIITFSLQQKADCYFIAHHIEANKLHLKAQIASQTISYTLDTIGMHFAMNSLACLASVYTLGGDVAKSAKALASFAPLKGRGQKHQLLLSGKNITLIDDSYNANPTSMKAALDTLHATKGARKIAILGDMVELGDNTIEFHKDLSQILKQHNIQLIAVGTLCKHLYEVMPNALKLAYFASQQDIKIDDLVKNDDVILVKASNKTALHAFVARLVNKS